jgi:tetratricopeptide (TPR) repeat protein
VVDIALHSVCDIRGAQIVVQADGEEVFEERMDLSATAPLRRQVKLPTLARESIDVAVMDEHCRELVGQHISLKPADKSRMPKAPHEKWENMFASLEGKDATARARIGQISELNNLWPRAHEAYESALQADPNCPEALMGLAFVALRNAKFDQAVRCGRRLMACDKRAWQLAGAYVLGVAEFSVGRVDEAVAALKAAAKHPKLGQMAKLFLAVAQARSGRTKDALKTAQALGEPVASMPMAQWLRAALAGDAFAEDPTGGWTIADEGELLDLGCERGIWAIRAGMPALGETIVDNLLKCGPAQAKEPLAWYLKGYLQHLQGNHAAAKASLTQAAPLSANNKRPTQPEWTDVLQWALQTNPVDRKPLGYLAPLEYWLARTDQALEHWRDLLAANGNGDASTYYGLAMGLWEARSDHKAAADILAEALAKDPTQERLYLVLDDVLVEANDVEPRGQWLDKALANCGQTDFITERYCHWLVNQQRWTEVIDLLTEHKFGPSHGMYIRRRMWLLAHHRLALRCLAVGDYTKACDYGLAGATPPATLGEDDMTMPFASPVLLAAAEACEKMGEKAKAKELLHQALRLAVAGHMHPPYTEIHRARVLLKLRRKQAAEKVLQEVLSEVLPRLEDSRAGLNKAHFHYLYALVLETRGQQDQARHHFEQADKLGLQWANLVGYSVQWGFN